MADIAEVKVDRAKATAAIETSLKILKDVGDKTVVNEAERIEAAVKEIRAVEVPLFETYLENLKDFDRSTVEKYGLTVARIIEFVMTLAIAAKLFILG